MGRPKKLHRKEHYYREAKRRGYRARSAFKLMQIAKTHHLLRGVSTVVELCSSPGGWTQVIRQLSNTARIIAVDLAPMEPLEGVIFIQGDITDPDTVEKIVAAAGSRVDLVLSDCSPKVTGYWEVDVARQLALAETTIEIGHRLLGRNGKVLAKVFQGPGFQEFLRTARGRFHTVRLLKPDASRRTSAEVYLLGIGPVP